MKLAVVEWIDSASDSTEWTDLDDILKAVPALIESVGWLVKETKDFVHVLPNIPTLTQGKQDGFGGIVIPRSAIKKIRRVK